MPVLPIAQVHIQHFVDTEHWRWPQADSNPWRVVGNTPEDLLPYGTYVQRRPETAPAGD
jgi:hypothetical protein